MSLLVLHHDDLVPLARLQPSLRARDLELVEVDATTAALPDPAGHAGVLVLGGRMGVADETAMPDFVDPELDFLRAAEDAEVPVFGICLGAQLLALAHGGHVMARATPEVAFVAVHRTVPGQDDPVTAGWPDGAHALAYHDDEVTRLPDAAEQLLVGSDGATMWRVGHAHATQLHPEADLETVTAWVTHPDADMATRAGVDSGAFLERAAAVDAQAAAVGTSLVMRWVDGLG